MRILLAVSAVTLWALAGTTLAQDASAVESVRLPPELARVLIDYEKGWRAGDGAALSELFIEDGFVLPNGQPPVRGRAAIRQYYKGPGGALVLRAFAFAAEGSIGYIIGGFSRREGEPDVGKFTLTLRKGSEGRWRIVSDMDNGNFRPRHSLRERRPRERFAWNRRISTNRAARTVQNISRIRR